MGYTLTQLSQMGAKFSAGTSADAATSAYQDFVSKNVPGAFSPKVGTGTNVSPATPALKDFIKTGAAPGAQPGKEGVLANLPSATMDAVKQTADTYKNAFNNSADSLAKAMNGEESPIAAGADTFKNFTQPTLDAYNKILSPASKLSPTLLNPIVDFISGKPAGTTDKNQADQQSLTSQMAKVWADKHPDAAKELAGLKNAGELGMLVGGAESAINDAPAAVDTVKQAGINIGSKVSDAVSSVGENLNNAAEKIMPSNPTPAVEAPKLSPEQLDLQNNITQSKQELEQAKSKADFAAEQRKNATPQAVESVKNINNQVSGNIKTLGTEFGNGAAELEKANPTMKLDLTNEQINALNNLKENKNFSLPEKIQQAQDAQASMPESKFGNIKLSGKALEEFNAGQKATQVSLSPTEAQDLIKELNRSTFRQNTDGSITKDYQRVGITNEIKNAASQAFGDQWDALYSKYAQGRSMIDKLDSITNLDSKATPEELNKQLEAILKQSKTPEGKLLLQQAIDEYKQSSGVDLNDPIKSIQQIADKQTALDEANSNLSDAQKAANKAQRDADVAKLKQEQKMSTFKGRHPELSTNANYFIKRAAWGLTGGAVIGALGLSGVLKKIFSGG